MFSPQSVSPSTEFKDLPSKSILVNVTRYCSVAGCFFHSILAICRLQMLKIDALL